MSNQTINCPNCGTALQQQTGFCPNCGARIINVPTSAPQVPSYYPPVPLQQPPVSTGPYKVAIGVLLIIILVLGIGLFVSGAHLPLSFGNYRYTLATAPSYQSTVPGPSSTSQTPYYTIWNACTANQAAGCSMSPSGWREGSVPDTFDYYVSFTSSVPVTVYFFTMGQFVQFSVCNGDISCVSGYYDSIHATTSLSWTVFTLGEGCADYLAIYVSAASGTMFPDVGVTYNHANSATGYCAQAGR